MPSLSYGRKTVDLIKLVARLKEQDRLPTPEERTQLGDWYGWGPVYKAFDTNADEQWQAIGTEIMMGLGILCGGKAIEEAKMSIGNSYYTDPLIARAMWKIATGLGFAGGRVLEPGCGTGHILACAPEGLPIRAVCYDRDPFAAMIARFRLPNAEIYRSQLQLSPVARRQFDLAIFNPPFSSLTIGDDDQVELLLSIHNYFLVYALRGLRPGGIAIEIVSRYLLDSAETKQREYIDEYADFLGAIRLPSGVHRAAQTEVLTDILVFRRREDETPIASRTWLTQDYEVVPPIGVNTYFAKHPERILGKACTGYDEHGKISLKVQQTPDFEARLEKAVQDLVAELHQEGKVYVPRKDISAVDENILHLREDHQVEGSFYLVNGSPIKIVGGKQVPVTQYKREIAGLICLRDAALALIDAEQDYTNSDLALKPLRDALNRAYDQYVRAHGPIMRSQLIHNQKDVDGETITKRIPPRHLQAFRTDLHFPTILGLVHYNDQTRKEKKSDIFFKRIHRKLEERLQAQDISEAMALSLDKYTYLDLSFMAKLLSTTEDTLPHLLKDLAFEDPQGEGAWVEASEYLSGNVRTKLVIACRAVERQGPRFQRNVEALELVVPADLPPEKIHPELGCTWIDAQTIEQFIFELLHMKVKVVYEPVSASWSVTFHIKGTKYSPEALTTWGTNKRNAIDLIEIGLNKRTPIVWDKIKEGKDEGNLKKNTQETIAAQDKLDAIRARFSVWIWESPERAQRLAARYNELFRSEVPRIFNGSFLTFPGMNPEWIKKMYPWQLSFIASMLFTRSRLCVHPVGAGKTMSMISAGMKLKQLGKIRLAAIVIANHMIEQVTSEAKRLYPTARILMITSDDLSTENKAVFAARVAVGEYDLVIMTHGALFNLSMHPDNEYAYLEEKINEYRRVVYAQLRDKKSTSPIKKRTLKEIQNKIVAMEARQQRLLKKEVKGVTFEQTNISTIFYDECQGLKNLYLPANTEGFSGTPSKRALDVEMKLRHLMRTNGGQPFGAFFSATPWANSTAEVHTMMHYLVPDLLERYGLRNLDAFIANFIRIEQEVEISPDGATFQQRVRPRGFFNHTDLMDLLYQFADIQPPEILDALRPRKIEKTIPIDPTPEIQQAVNALVQLASDIHSGGKTWFHGHQASMLDVVGEGRKLATSPRLAGITTGLSVKVDAVVRKTMEIWQKCQRSPVKLPGKHQSLQIIFCDIGTPSKEKGDQVYGELKAGLIALGMPANAIRFVHEAKSDTQKGDLFQACREGEVAVLIGSTEKLGTGTNIQDRCVAIHLMSVPYRPDMIIQCIGRAHRPGNSYEAVWIYRYVMKGTFDAYMWQLLERKAHFMAQLLAGKVTEREFDMESDMELSFRAVKAAATGDPVCLEQASVDMDASRLQRLAQSHLQGSNRTRQMAVEARIKARGCRSYAEGNKRLADYLQQGGTTGFITREGTPLTVRQEIGHYIMQQVYKPLMEGKRGLVPIGSWSSLPLSVDVQGEVNCLSLEIKIHEARTGEPVASIAIQPQWMRGATGDKKDGNEHLAIGEQPTLLEDTEGAQQWRIAYAIEQYCTKIHSEYERYLDMAEKSERAAIVYEQQADVPFAQEKEFRRLLARKAVLDDYAQKVASRELNEEEIDAMRRHILATATRDYSLDLALPEQQEEEEVFRLSEKTISSLRELEGMTVPLVVSLFEQVPESPKPVELVRKPSIVEKEQRERLVQVKEQAEEQIEKLNLEELVAVSLFADIAPRTVQEMNKRKRPRKEAPTQSAPAKPVQQSLFGSLSGKA